MKSHVSEALFYTGCDTPSQGPFLGRPILGASNHGYFALFASLCGYLIAGVRKHRKHFKGIYFTKEFNKQNNEYMGGIEWQQRQTQHISIYPSGD